MRYALTSWYRIIRLDQPILEHRRKTYAIALFISTAKSYSLVRILCVSVLLFERKVKTSQAKDFDTASVCGDSIISAIMELFLSWRKLLRRSIFFPSLIISREVSNWLLWYRNVYKKYLDVRGWSAFNQA